MFWHVSQRAQIDFIIIDNVGILCLSCNVKNAKTTAKLAKDHKGSAVTKLLEKSIYKQASF